MTGYNNLHKVIDLTYLAMATDQISKAKDFHSVCEIIFNFIEGLVPFNMAVIYQIDKNHEELKVASCRGSNIKNLKRRIPFKIGEGAVGWVARNKKALLLDDALKSGEIQIRQFYDEDPIIRSFLAVPLIVGNDLVGIISMSSSKECQYKQLDVEMITIIASQGAAMLELNHRINETTALSNHILENINSGVVVIDNDYKVIVFNKAAERISGYSRTDILNRSISEIPLKDAMDDLYIVESMEKEKIFFESSSYMIAKNGRHVNIRLSTSILRNDNGVKNGCICIFRDNTEVERLQQQVVRAENLATIGRMTSVIAHEIRNPLLPIRTGVQLLLKKVTKQQDNEDIIKLLNIISHESERMNRFLDQLVGSKKRSSQAHGSSQLKEVLEETLILMSHSLEDSNISLKLHGYDGNMVLPFSKDQLKQILLNLIINSIDAIKAAEILENGEISINTYNNDGKIVIEFIDNGCGISADDINKIFDPFFTTKDTGTGLGLATIQSFINGVGGEIVVDSKLGQGTRFLITIPSGEGGD